MHSHYVTALISVGLAFALVGCGEADGTTSGTGGSSGSSSSGDDPTTTTPPTTTTVDPMTTTMPDPDSSTTDAPGTSTDEPGTTTDEPGTTTDEPGTTTGEPGTESSTGEPVDPVDMCLQEIDKGDACGECACNNCLAELSACNADPGCTAIRECAQEAMCSGLACLGPCGETIDDNGGFAGPSAMLALTLSGCIDDNCAGDC